MKKILFFALTLGITAGATAQIHNETTDGDLSDAFDNPSGPFILVSGNNMLLANQLGDPRDIDYLTIVIPEDFQLDALFLDGYTAEGTNNTAFLGIQEGAAFTTDAMNTTASDLLGGIVYGSAELDTDMLPAIGQLGDGFTPPLQAGTYTLWLNQTGPLSEATMRFVISETLSIEETNLANSIRLFPNPAREQLSISAPNTELLGVTIYSITGEEVLTTTNPSFISLRNLSSGVYFGQIETSLGNVTKRIIKL